MEVLRGQSVESRKATFDRLTPKTQALLRSIYGSASNFIYAELTGNYIDYLEEACLTYESALEFDPSADVVLQLLTKATRYDYVGNSIGIYPLLAAETAIRHAIFHRNISLV